MKSVPALLVLLALASPVQAQRPKRIDWPSTITAAAGLLADTASTTHGLAQGRCHESNQFLGAHPSTATLYLNTAVTLGLFVAVNALAEHSHSKRFQSISHAMNYSIGGVTGFAAVSNLRKCG